MKEAPPSDRTALREQMRRFYQQAAAYKQQLRTHTEAYLASYVALVERFVPSGAFLLELGAGLGVGARMLGDRGYRVVATDISPLFLREAAPWQSERLMCIAADGLQLPFVEGVFDAVCSHQYLEHIPDVSKALDEMGRVLRPGGRVVLVGPNLLSPLVPLLEWWQDRRRLEHRPQDHLDWRSALRGAVAHLIAIEQKRWGWKTDFLYRQPELDPTVHGGDRDAAYWTCPLDLRRYFRQRGWRVVAQAAGVRWKGRLLARWLPNWSPHLCFVAEKPIQEAV